jgi:hypothetical protein
MHSKLRQDLSQIDSFRTIDFQTASRCPANRSNANYISFCFIPQEMVRPKVFSWIEQPDHFVGKRIKAFCFVVFGIIAELAGVGQIFQVTCPSQRKWQNMIDGKSMKAYSELARQYSHRFEALLATCSLILLLMAELGTLLDFDSQLFI